MINQERYGALKKRLANEWALGKDSYPKTMGAAAKLIEQFEDEHGSGRTKKKAAEDEVGVGFGQVGLPKAKNADVECFGCGKKRHYGWQCPDTSEKKKKELYSEDAKAARAVKAGKIGVNHLTSAAKGASEESSTGAASKSSGKSSRSNSSKEEKRQKKPLAFYNAMQLYADISDSESKEELGVGHLQVG